MSDRGAFTTEFIYCQKCFEAVRNVLLNIEQAHWISVNVLQREGKDAPIIAGYISSHHTSGELHYIEFDIIPELEEVICHTVRIAVLAEVGAEIFTAFPIEDKWGKKDNGK